MKEEKIEHEFIGKLEKNEEQEIKALCDKHEIKFRIDKKLKFIIISGLSNLLYPCYTDLQKYLNDKNKKAVDAAIEIGRLIQWEYSMDKKTWHSYNIDLNK